MIQRPNKPKPQRNARDPQARTPQAAKITRRHHRLRWLLPAAVLLITAAAFSPTLRNDFIETWDDGVYVTENPTITSLDAANIKTMFTTPVNGTYVPLPLMSLALDYHFFKLDPTPYHVNNLILHLICTGLAFWLLLLLGLNPWFAAFAALLFGIHPMRVESVAWITERKDLLFSMFYLSALIAYTHGIRSAAHKTRFYLLTLVFFILSLFSKIQAVSLPLSLLVIDYYFDRPLRFRLLWEKIPHFALSLGFGLAGVFILERTGSLEINLKYSLVDRLMFGIHSLWTYIQKLFYPSPLSIYYPYPMAPGKPVPLALFLSLGLLLAVSTLVFLTRRKTKVVVFASLFFFFNVVFLLQILGAGQAYMADRFTYIPYLGFFFLAGWAAQQIRLKKKSLFPLILLLMVLIPVVHYAMTDQRSREWRDSESLWTAVIRDFPGQIATAYANRASHYRKINRWPEARKDYSIAIRLDPNNPVSIMNRGNLFFDEGKIDSAYADYMRVMKIEKKGMDLDRLYANLGAVYGMRKMNDSALYYLNLSIRLDSLFPNAYLNRALLYENFGKPEEAVRDYQTYLRFKPEDDRVYSSIGVNFQRMKRYEESIGWFERGISVNPRNGLHYNNRSYSWNGLGNRGKALEDIRKARELGYPVSPEYARFLETSP